MPDWIYCGTEQQADAQGTQNLLRTHQAVWCSSPRLRAWPGEAAPGERLWLVWRATNSDSTSLLGGGTLLRGPREVYHSTLLWTEADLKGLRAEAVKQGYSGPTSMSFLRLSNVVFPDSSPIAIVGLGHLVGGLNAATAEQTERLEKALRIPDGPPTHKE